MKHRMFYEMSFFYHHLCDSVGERYAQLVFRSGNSASLWSLKAIYSMCQMEETQVNQGHIFPKGEVNKSLMEEVKWSVLVDIHQHLFSVHIQILQYHILKR